MKRSDHIFEMGHGCTPKAAGMTNSWEPVCHLAKEICCDTAHERMPNMKCGGYKLMAIYREGDDFSLVVDAKVDF